MKQYKRIISLLIVIDTLTSAVPQVMAADAADTSAQSAVVYSTEVSETAVAVVDGVEYNSLEAAVNAAPANGTVVLCKDVEVSNRISISKNITIVANELSEEIYIKRAASYREHMFEVTSGASLVLGGAGSRLVIDGGAVWNESGTNVGVTATWPVVYINTGKLTVQSNAVIQNNYNGSGDGGAVATKGGGSAVIYIYGALLNNRAKTNGGALSANCYVYMYDGAQMSGNTADSNGGVLYLNGGGIAEITGGTFTGTTAGGDGGVIWQDGRTTISGGSFKGNAAQNGGAVYISAAQSGRSCYINGGEYTGNSAANNDDIYLGSDYCYFRGGVVADNVYLPGTRKLNIQGALSGSIGLSTQADPLSRPQVTAGIGYNVTEADAEKIRSYSDIAETVYQNGAVIIKYHSVNITSQPEDKIIYIGDAADLSFEISMPAASGEPQYTWYKCSDINGSNA